MGLRNEVVRLAHANPKMRPFLLPLLRQAAIPRGLHKLQDATSQWDAAMEGAIREVIHAPEHGQTLIQMLTIVRDGIDKQVKGLKRQYRG